MYTTTLYSTYYRVICNSGYIAHPDHRTTSCQQGGVWDNQLLCEVPLVILSGGQTADRVYDSSVEIIDFAAIKVCKPHIFNMPMMQGEHRHLHNLLYDPNNNDLLACNGLLSGNRKASCSSWKLRPPAIQWKFHSYPNEGDELDMMIDDGISRIYDEGFNNFHVKAKHPEADLGRYAAVSSTLASVPVIMGGIVYNDDNHISSNNSR